MANAVSSEPVLSASSSTPGSDAFAWELPAFQRALEAYEQQPENDAARTQVTQPLRTLASHVAALARREQEHPLVLQALHVIPLVGAAGLHDYPVAEQDRAALNGRPLQQWPNLLAMMLLGSAWQWEAVPALEAVPQWLWADYTAWVFTPPQGFTAAGDAERYAKFVLGRCEELARLVERNLGSASVRAAGDAYLRKASGIPLYFSQDSLRRHAEARGRILKRLLGRETTVYDPLPFPRTGRRLRVGFLNRHFGSQTETYTTLPTFEQLDPERFEVILFSLRDADSELAAYCRIRAQDYRVLPGDVEAQLAMLRDANLDVLVFGTNVTAVVHEVTRLALYRIAPLQIVNNSSCVTSGFPDVDLYVSGDLTECSEAPTHFTERLGLVPGPAHAFNYTADKQDPSGNWTREALGIPEGAPVFVTAANYFKIVPEMQQAWARLLASVPDSRLVIHPFNPNWSSSYPIKRFCAEFDRVLAEHGVGTDRLIVSTAKFPSRSDVRELLSVGDVYLDTFPFGGVNSLVDPLEAGIPVVAWEGATFRSRMGGALLRSLALPELIVGNETDYIELARSLAVDSARRAGISTRIRDAMERSPVFLDPLAASDAFGDLMERAFDEIVALGHVAFRADRTPLTAVTGAADETAFDEASIARAALRAAPADCAARHRYGNALLANGNVARACEYLLAAIQSNEHNAALWFDLAVALQRNGQMQQALQALEASLRIDVKNVAAWRMVVQVAESAGAFDMVAEANSVLDHLTANAASDSVQAVG